MGIFSKNSTLINKIESFFLEFYEEKKLALFSSLFHEDLQFFVSENIVLNYSEYELFCQKILNDQLRIKLEFIEKVVIEENKFLFEIFLTLAHKNYEKLEFPISVIMLIKEGKIVGFEIKSSVDWTMVEYLMEPLADVLNGFEISSYSTNSSIRD